MLPPSTCFVGCFCAKSHRLLLQYAGCALFGRDEKGAAVTFSQQQVDTLCDVVIRLPVCLPVCMHALRAPLCVRTRARVSVCLCVRPCVSDLRGFAETGCLACVFLHSF